MALHTHTCTRALKMRDKVKRMPLPTIAATAECATLHTREVQDPKPFTMTCAVCRRAHCISAAAEAQEHYIVRGDARDVELPEDGEGGALLCRARYTLLGKLSKAV
jgi:hypothetical protein